MTMPPKRRNDIERESTAFAAEVGFSFPPHELHYCGNTYVECSKLFSVDGAELADGGDDLL